MHMLHPTIQCPDKDVFRTGIFSNMLEYLISDRFYKNRFAVFCCPNKMDPNTYMRHTRLLLMNYH